jgi:protein O-mannosyl-transferase
MNEYLRELESLPSEPVASVRERERTALDRELAPLRPEQSSGAGARGRTAAEWLSAWFGAIAGTLIFLPTLWYGFVWDDRYSIVTNTSLKSWKTLAQILWGPMDATVSMYRPVTGVIIFFQFHLFGLHPWGYHLTSVLLHAIACALIFRVALQLSATRSVALFASLLFAVHDAHLEAVAWVSALAEPLVVSFVLAGLSAYLRYRRERQWKWLAAISVSLFLGLLTKETAIALPLLLLAYEFTFGDSDSRKLRRNLPLVAALSSTVFVYVVMRHFAYKGFIYNESRLPFRVLFFTWPSLLVTYGRHLVIPTLRSPFYDSDYVVAANWSFWLPLAILIAIAGAACFASKRLAGGALIQFCTLGMVISIIPALDLNIFQYREIMHDRFLYLPSVFFAIPVSYLLFGTHKCKDAAHRSDGKRRSTTAYAALGACLVLLNGAALLIQSPVWSNDLALFSYAVRIAPGNPRPAFALAEEYLERGDLSQAEQLLQHVVRLVPAPKAFALLGQTLLRMGNPQAAEEPLRRAIAAAPDRPGQHFMLGQCLQGLGRTDEANVEFRTATALSQDSRQTPLQQLPQSPAAKP